MFSEGRGSKWTCTVYLSRGESGGRACGGLGLQDASANWVL